MIALEEASLHIQFFWRPTVTTVPLTASERRALAGRANDLACSVRIGRAGVSPGALAEVARALDRAPLIKVRLSAGDRTARATEADELARACAAQLVGTVGRYAILFREASGLTSST